MNSEERVLEVHLPSRPERLKMLRCLVRDAALMNGCDNDTAEQVVLAVNEACMNIIQHAYQGSAAGEIVLEIVNNGRELIFRLRDFAEPVDIERIKPRQLDDLRPGGLGTHFMREVMDEITYSALDSGAGNQLEMRKRIR